MPFSKGDEIEIKNLIAAFDQPNSPGCVLTVAKKGADVFTMSAGQANLEHLSPINTQTVFDVGSMAKMFVGMSIALLEKDGVLSLEDKLNKFIPEYLDYAKDVRLANLLFHTSGIRNYTVMAYYMIGYHPSDAITNDEVLDLIMRAPSLNFLPGSRWEYSDSNYFLLAEIIRRVTGKSLADYTDEVLFKPLGMQNTLFREDHSKVIPNRALSYVKHVNRLQSPYLQENFSEPEEQWHLHISNYEHVGAEGLFTTIEDLLKWAEHLRNNRLGEDNASLISRYTLPGAKINDTIGYGYGINVGTYKGKCFFGHDGAIHGYTSSFMHLVDDDITLISLTNQNQMGAWTIRNKIIDLLFPDEEQKQGKQPTNPKPEIKDIPFNLIGKYQNPETATIWEIKNKEKGLSITENDEWEFEILHNQDYCFEQSEISLAMNFEVDVDGRVIRISGTQQNKAFCFLPFINEAIEPITKSEYAGKYQCLCLQTSFLVAPAQAGLLVRNSNKHFCSMDLVYSPSIKDFFIAYDPHPGISQISFLRENGKVTAFIYRDYDGDGREAFRFEKVI